jgi:hypothetical protein
LSIPIEIAQRAMRSSDRTQDAFKYLLCSAKQEAQAWRKQER